MRRIKMHRSVAGRGSATYTIGREYDVTDRVAAAFTGSGAADDVTPDKGYEPDPEPAQPAQPAEDASAGDEPSDEEPEDEVTDEGDGLDDLKLPDLRDLAEERGLPTSGKKDELIARLREDDAQDGD